MATFSTRVRDVLGTLTSSRRPDFAPAGDAPLAVSVPGVARDVRVKIASERDEWEQAFRLVGANYQARGYQAPDSGDLRFTPHHALPDTVTFVAKQGEQVVATFGLVPDNTLVGLPMESIYGPEIWELRREGRRVAEITCLADQGLGLREFIPVFTALKRVLFQYFIARGGDTWVFTVNPRHANFYRKVMGAVPLGECRAYPTVENAPAEAYLLDVPVIRERAPETYEKLFGEPLPREALRARPLPVQLVHYFAGLVGPEDRDMINCLLTFSQDPRGLRRWDVFEKADYEDLLRGKLMYTRWCWTQTEEAKAWTFL